MMIGSLISSYRIIEKIGGGNTGVVYKAYDLNHDRVLALKILANDFLITKEKRARFLRESRAATILSHDTIARLFDVGKSEDYYYLAMEFVNGKTYGQIIGENRSGVAMDLFYKMMLPVIDGIGYAHEQQLAHRDIKPDNLKMAESGEPKVLDFGLVKFLGKDHDSGQDSFRTMRGMVIGSAGYMSPEQASGEILDERTDIFSLGVLMYELLTGKNPFNARSFFDAINRVINAHPISIELLRPEISMRLGEIVLRCLHKDMNRRYPNARALHQALLELKA